MYDVDPPVFKDYDVAEFPVGPGGTHTVSGFYSDWVAIPQGSRHRAEAFAWLDYLTSVGMPYLFSVTPELPANNTVSRNLVPAIVIKKRGKAFAEDITRFFHHMQDISIPMWTSPVQDFANDQLTKAVSRIMSKAVSPKQGLAEAQQACQTQLKKIVH